MQPAKIEIDTASYGLKIWLTCIFIGPVVAFMINTLCIALGQDDNAFPFGAYVMLCYGYGMFFSLPALVAFMVIIHLLDYAGVKEMKFRLAVLVTALLLLSITFWMLGAEFEMSDIVHGTKLSPAYALLICISVFLYRPHKAIDETA